MKGVINKGIQEMIEAKFGHVLWEKIKERAGCEEPAFVLSIDYPDEMSVALVQAAAEILDLPMESVMIDFGRYWVPNTGKSQYPSYFALAGATPGEFLLNLDRIHEHVTQNIPGAKPPRFEIEELADE